MAEPKQKGTQSSVCTNYTSCLVKYIVNDL